MKKVISVLLILVFVLSGCSSDNNNVAAEKYNWSFSRVSQGSNDEVIFTSSENEAKYSNAKTIDLDCSVTADEIIITDSATNKSWTLKYTLNKDIQTSGNEGSNYVVTYSTEEGTVKGYATTGIANTNFVYYLIITINNYNLYFIANAE